MGKKKGIALTKGRYGDWVKTKERVIWVSHNRKTRKEDEARRLEGNLPGIAQVGWALSRLYW